jgi:hypothetical protein
MDRRYACAIFLAVLIACLQIAGCGGGGTGTSTLVISSSTLPQGTVGQAYSAQLFASGGTTPYTWSETSGGNMPDGVTFSSAGSFVGTPTKPGSFGPYVFQVTDEAGNKASTPSVSITIVSSSITVNTTSLPNGTINVAYSVTLSASGGTPPYTWAETSGGSLPPGLTLTGAVISGTPTATGSYGPYVFAVTDSNNATAATGNLMITVTTAAAAVCTPAGNEAALTSSTPYAFLLKGTDGTGNPIDIAGSFTPNGSGGITSAAVDYNGMTNGPEQLQVNLAASSYSFSSGAQGCLYLSFEGLAAAIVKSAQGEVSSGLKVQVKGHNRVLRKPETAAVPVANVQFSFYLGSNLAGVYQSGRIIESDNTTGTGTNATGSMYVQNPSDYVLSALQSNFAFGVDGWTAAEPSILRTALGGSFTNTSGTISAVFADLDLGGTASGEMTGGTGTLNSTIDTSNGRGTGTIFLTTPNGPLTLDFAFYIVSGSDFFLLTTDLASSSNNTALLAGRALASASSYGTTPLNAYYLLAAEGYQTASTTTGNIAEIGTFNATNTGTIPTATIYSNLAGTYASNQYTNSTYTVEAASGRVTITNLLAQSPVVYLTAGSTSDDQIAGFLVGTDAQSSSGVIVGQTILAPSYGQSSVTGNYVSSTDEDVDGANGSFLGDFSFSGSVSYTLTSQTTGTLTNIPASSGSIQVNGDGSGNLDGGSFLLVTNGNVIFAIPDSGDPLLYVLVSATAP